MLCINILLTILSVPASRIKLEYEPLPVACMHFLADGKILLYQRAEGLCLLRKEWLHGHLTASLDACASCTIDACTNTTPL